MKQWNKVSNGMKYETEMELNMEWSVKWNYHLKIPTPPYHPELELIAYLAFSGKGSKLGGTLYTLRMLKILLQLKIQKRAGWIAFYYGGSYKLENTTHAHKK